MSTTTSPQSELKGENLLREMERLSNDECMIYNPTKDDYVVNWDGRTFVVPGAEKNRGYGKGALVVPRYIAKYYLKHMTDKLINEEYERKIKTEKAAFEKRGEWFGQKEIQIAPRTNDEQLRIKYMKMLWGGVVREFGKDEVPNPDKAVGRADTRPMTDRLLDEVEASGEYKKQAAAFVSQIGGDDESES